MEYFNPSTTCSHDQEVFMKKNVFTPRERKDRNIRYQDCFLQQGMTKNYLPKKLQQQMDFSETSSSSSSSSSESSSDSEEELNTVMKPRIPSKYLERRTQQQLPREWFTVVDLEGFRPQDVTAKLNPKCRILVIKVKKNNIRQQCQQSEEDVLQEGQTFGKKLVRIIPLPENIHLEELRVKVTTGGELVVKAPFIARGEFMQQKQYQRNFPSTWIPLRIKGSSDLFETQQQPIMKRQPRNWFTNENTNVNFNINKRKQFREQQMMDNYPATSFIGYPQTEDVRGREWSKARKNMAGGLFQHTSTNNTLRTEYIRDEVTGKPAMLVKVNVIGFQPEEVRVRVDETEKLLIVEATQRTDLTVQRQQQEEGLTVKFLRREFFLPEFVDVKHIAFRVLKTGVLAIKLPMLKNMKNVTQGSDEEEVREENMVNFNKWEKPVRA